MERFSAYAVEQARKRDFSQVVQGSILGYDQNELYDLITFWDVLEHLESPRQSLQKAFSLLRPGGYIAISTGDIESNFAKISGRFWHLLTPPNICIFFPTRTIRILLHQVVFNH
jgi:2-polyprenyl-3-methyl-5-hydroxy-6-metoxy-1,4-benzoquinol methylase